MLLVLPRIQVTRPLPHLRLLMLEGVCGGRILVSTVEQTPGKRAEGREESERLRRVSSKFHRRETGLSFVPGLSFFVRAQRTTPNTPLIIFSRRGIGYRRDTKQK